MKAFFYFRKIVFLFFLPLYGSENVLIGNTYQQSFTPIILAPKGQKTIISFDKNVPEDFFKFATSDCYYYIKKRPTYVPSVYDCLHMGSNNVLYVDQKSVEDYIVKIKPQKQKEYLIKNKSNIFSCLMLTYVTELYFKGVPIAIHKEDKYTCECLVKAYYLADFLLCHTVLRKDMFFYDQLQKIAVTLLSECLSFDNQIKIDQEKQPQS